MLTDIEIKTLKAISDNPGTTPADLFFTKDLNLDIGVDYRCEEVLLSNGYIENQKKEGMALYLTSKGSSALVEFKDRRKKEKISNIHLWINSFGVILALIISIFIK